MSKFNSKTTTKIINKAGGEAFSQDPKLAFVSLLFTSFLTSQAYRSEDETMQELSALIDQIPDKKFVAKSAIYARTVFGMRSVSHVVAGELAKRVKGEIWTKSFFDKIVYRPDDMGEILSYIHATGMKTEPNALKKGFALALSRFDEYKLGKYQGKNNGFSLVDIINLVHPTPTDAISKLMNGELPVPQTWEVLLSQTGKDAKTEEEKETLKAAVWKTLIIEKQLGYFALLRNLRNILEQAPDMVPAAIAMLTDEKLIRSSLVLPFRFVTAIEEMEKLSHADTALVRKILVGLNIAIDIALKNVPTFDGNTLVVLDESGSMSGKPIKIGSLFAASLVKSNNADLLLFSHDAHFVHINPMDSTLSIAKNLKDSLRGGGTNFHSIFEEASKVYDRIIILSDMQGWIGSTNPSSAYHDYKVRSGAKPKIYSFDLAGLGSLQFPEKDIFCIAGFSEKVFDLMKLLEKDKKAVIQEVEKIDL